MSVYEMQQMMLAQLEQAVDMIHDATDDDIVQYWEGQRDAYELIIALLREADGTR